MLSVFSWIFFYFKIKDNLNNFHRNIIKYFHEIYIEFNFWILYMKVEIFQTCDELFCNHILDF